MNNTAPLAQLRCLDCMIMFDDDDDPFVFRNWQGAVSVVSDIEGPFRIKELDVGLPVRASLGKVQAADLVLPDLDSFTYGALEEIATEAPSIGGSDVGPTPADQAEQDPWTIPEVLTLGHEPRLRTWDAFLTPNHHEAQPSLLSEAGPQVFDAVLSEYQKGDDLVLDADFVLRCLFLLAQGQSSPLFSRQTSALVFSTFDHGRFRASGLSDPALKSLIQSYKTMGERTVGLLDYVDRTVRSKQPSVPRVALATCIRTLLEADRRRTLRGLSALRSFVQLQALFEGSGFLLEMLHRLREACSSSINDDAAVGTLLAELKLMQSSHHLFPNTMRAIAIAISGPKIDQLLVLIGLRPKELSDLDATHGLLEHLSSTESGVSGSFPTSPASQLLGDAGRHLVQDIALGLDALCNAAPDHPLVLGVGQPLLRGLDLHDPDPDAILQKARQYDLAVTKALHDVKPENRCRHDVSEDNVSEEDSLPEAFDELSPEAFTSLGNRFTSLPNTDAWLSSNTLTKAYTNDISDYLSSPSSLTTDAPLLGPLHPLLSVQATLVNDSVLHLIFHTHSLLQHLSLLHAHHFFSSPSFLSDLTTALFSSLSPSPRLPSSTAPGLRLDSRSTRWPPTASDLRLSLAGILSSTPLPAGSGLSFALHPLSSLSMPAQSSISDPTSPHALSWLRLTYTPPPALAPLFPPATLALYERAFTLLLTLQRALHAAAHLTVALAALPRGPAHAFALTAHRAVAALASHLVDLGIAPVWARFVAALQRADPAVSSDSKLRSVPALRNEHAACLASIAGRLLLLADQRGAYDALLVVVGIVLRGAGVLSLGTGRAAVSDFSSSEGSGSGARVGELVAELKEGIRGFDAEVRNMADGKGGEEGEYWGALRGRLEWWTRERE